MGSVFHALPWKVARRTLWYAFLLFIVDGIGSYFMIVKDQNDMIESEREGLEYSGDYYLYTQLSNLLSPVIYCLLLGFKLKDHSIWKRMLGLGFARGCVSFCLFEGTMAYNRADNFIKRMLIRTFEERPLSKGSHAALRPSTTLSFAEVEGRRPTQSRPTARRRRPTQSRLTAPINYQPRKKCHQRREPSSETLLSFTESAKPPE